jgi:hypothetical protein
MHTPAHMRVPAFTHSRIHAFTHSRIHAFTHSRIHASLNSRILAYSQLLHTLAYIAHAAGACIYAYPHTPIQPYSHVSIHTYASPHTTRRHARKHCSGFLKSCIGAIAHVRIHHTHITRAWMRSCNKRAYANVQSKSGELTLQCSHTRILVSYMHTTRVY